MKSTKKAGVRLAGFQLITSTPLRELKNVDTESWPSPITPLSSKPDKKQISKIPIKLQLHKNVKETSPAVQEIEQGNYRRQRRSSLITPLSLKPDKKQISEIPVMSQLHRNVKETSPAVQETEQANYRRQRPSLSTPLNLKPDKKQISEIPVMSQLHRNVKETSPAVQEKEHGNDRSQRFVIQTRKSRSKDESDRRGKSVKESATMEKNLVVPLTRYVEGSSISSERKQNKQALDTSVHNKERNQNKQALDNSVHNIERNQNKHTLDNSIHNEERKQNKQALGNSVQSTERKQSKQTIGNSIHNKTSKQLQEKERVFQTVVEKDRNLRTSAVSSDDEDIIKERNVRMVDKRYNSKKSRKQVEDITSKLYNEIGKVSIVSSSDEEEDYDAIKKLPTPYRNLQINTNSHIRKSPRKLQASEVLTKVIKPSQKKKPVKKSSGKIDSLRNSGKNKTKISLLESIEEDDEFDILATLSPKIGVKLTSARDSGHKSRSVRQQEEINHSTTERDNHQLSSEVDAGMPSTDYAKGTKSRKRRQERINNNAKERDKELNVETPSTSTADKNTRNSTRQQKKKKQSDEDLPRNEGVRHSKRKRVKPLEYWRGERLVYEHCADDCYKIVDVAPGRKEDPWWAPKHFKRPVTSRKRKSSDSSDDTFNMPARKLITVPTASGECELECFSTPRLEDATVTFGGDMKIYTNIEVPGITFGQIEVFPQGHTKPLRSDNDLVFYIVSGKLNVTIHETIQLVSKGESFFVPRGVNYELQNITKNSVFLTYTMCE